MECPLLISYRLEFGVRNCSKVAVETVYEPNPGYNYHFVNEKVSRNTAMGALIKNFSVGQKHSWLLQFEICYSEK